MNLVRKLLKLSEENSSNFLLELPGTFLVAIIRSYLFFSLLELRSDHMISLISLTSAVFGAENAVTSAPFII